MIVTLQYKDWDRQLRMSTHETTQDAIHTAVEMVRSRDGRTPKRILNHNGTIIIHQAQLEKAIQLELQDTTFGVKEDKQRAAKDAIIKEMECIPGYGTF